MFSMVQDAPPVILYTILENLSPTHLLHPLQTHNVFTAITAILSVPIIMATMNMIIIGTIALRFSKTARLIDHLELNSISLLPIFISLQD